MSIESVTARGQAAAEQLQQTPFTFWRMGKPGRPDPVTGVVQRSKMVVWSGTARVKELGRITAGGVQAGEAKDSANLYVISVPTGVTGVKPGDAGTPTQSDDPDLLTDVFRVTSIGDSNQATARRITCELVEART